MDALNQQIGAMAAQPLGVPGDDLPGNSRALDLLREYHRGEPAEFKGKRALVVGGGDAALDAARTLVRLGASSVCILYRRSREEMPAHSEEVDAAESEGVDLLTRMLPVRVLGEERVEGLVAIRTEPGPPDESGRRSPVKVSGSEIEIASEIIVSAVGQRPDLSFLDADIGRDADGSILIDAETGATSAAGVFAGGDLTPGPKTVIHAIADGRRAAYGIDLHLAEEGSAVVPLEFMSTEDPSFFTPRNLVVEPGHKTSLRPAGERRGDHQDVVIPLGEREALGALARFPLAR